MARFVVHETAVVGPATHALVIGSGSYPHLNGGKGRRCDEHEGLGQLTSPPLSARQFADWLIREFSNPRYPLASVALLISEPANVVDGQTSRYTNPKTGRTYELERARITAVEQAITQWKARGDGDPQHMTIFYFCGHGIAQGSDAALLMEDFGAKKDNALDGAIDFRRLHLGMNRCAASRQCYFIDACRASSDMLIQNREYAGRTIIQHDKNARRGKPARQAPVFYASLAGEAAYARRNQPSVFTEALLNSFRGAGSDDEEGDWRVSTNRLSDALDYFMRRERERGGSPVQIPATGDSSKVEIHYVGAPSVPVEVCCRPEDAIEKADLACLRDGAPQQERPATGGKWLIDLAPGEYEFRATFPLNEFSTASKRHYVRPPYRVVALEVQQ